MKMLALCAIAAAGLMAASSANAETTECTEITTIPIVITVQGVYCFKQHLGTAITTGNAIEIQTSNVTIDFNGFKLGGLAAGPGTSAKGIYSANTSNITIRNGIVRGFQSGIYLLGLLGGNSQGHLIEDMLLDRNTAYGTNMNDVKDTLVRNNRIVDTGPGDNFTSAVAIRIGSGSTDVIIEDNIISGVSETFSATGILVNASNSVQLRGNVVQRIVDAMTRRGIYLDGGDDILVLQNRILNLASIGGEFGINVTGSGTNISCINNVTIGFGTGIDGCNYVAGNHTP